jgi:anti-sigma regulatory factor (Ser/Thr protein kinase)
MRAIVVKDSSQIAESRQVASRLATRLGFDATGAGRVALVATELATNIIKHGGGGEMLIGDYDAGRVGGVQLIALDKGQGIGNLARSFEDGYSSAGTAGHGLGAIRRQSQQVEIATWPGLGTAVLARIAADGNGPASDVPVVAWGCVSIPLQGEEVCGDDCAAVEMEAGLTLIVADGLGHGIEAAVAANEAVRLFQRYKAQPIPELLSYLHDGLRATRGAAVAIARLDSQQGKVQFGGIGNISGVIIAPGATRRMVSLNGTAGHNARKILAFDYAWPGGIVVMHSDGLGTGWSLDRYPGLARMHPVLIAAVLYRDFTRHRDDVTVMVARGAQNG